jgi:hypothetical protein
MAVPSFARVLKIIVLTLVSIMVLNGVARLVLRQRIDAATAASQAGAGGGGQEREPESEQFLAGQDWSAANKPLRGSQCPGSADFIRGCRKEIEARRQANVLLGREWARQHQPALASACRGPVPYVVLGCRQYYFERLAKPLAPGQGSYDGMSTAECAQEVNANFEAAQQLDLENGNPQSAAVTARKSWGPALKDCDNLDRMADNAFMPPAYDRLQKVLDKLAAGQPVAESEHAAVRSDFTRMASIREQPYKSAYMAKFDDYTARLGKP